MVRRRWPDVVIVLAIIGIGVGGVWALWGDRLREPRKPAGPASSEASTPMT